MHQVEHLLFVTITRGRYPVQAQGLWRTTAALIQRSDKTRTAAHPLVLLDVHSALRSLVGEGNYALKNFLDS